MDTKELHEFTVPNWALPALINGDFSGLTKSEKQMLNDFTDKVAADLGNAGFVLGDMESGENDLGFKWRNSIDNVGSDCTRLYLIASK